MNEEIFMGTDTEENIMSENNNGSIYQTEHRSNQPSNFTSLDIKFNRR